MEDTCPILKMEVVIMDKLPKDLPKEEKLNYILQLIDKGYDRKYITENTGYSRPDSLDRFITKFGFTVDKETNKYARQMEDTCPTDDIVVEMEDSCPIDVVQEDTCPTVSIQNQQKLIDIIDNHNSIMAIANNSDRFMKMLEKFEAMEDTCPTEVIEIVSGLQINYNKSEVIKTTVRVDKNIWNEFSNLCIDKYSQFSKIDILSQLLHEFIEKYK